MLRRDRTGCRGKVVANSFEILHLESRTLMSALPWFAQPEYVGRTIRATIPGLRVPVVAPPVASPTGGVINLVGSGVLNVQNRIVLPIAGVLNDGGTIPVTITGTPSVGGTATISSGVVSNGNITQYSGTGIVGSSAGVLTLIGAKGPSGKITLGSGTLITNNASVNDFAGNATVNNFSGGILIAPSDGNGTFISDLPKSLQIGTVSNTGGIVSNQGGTGIVTLPGTLTISPGTFIPGSFLSLGTTGTAGTLTGLNTLIQPGSSSGATAIAVIDSHGNLTGINIVNPGSGYTQPPTFIVGAAGNIGTPVLISPTVPV